MILAEHQAQLISNYLLVEDSQERLAVLVEQGRAVPSLEESFRIDEHLVPGCISRVWLVGGVAEEDGLFHLKIDADSPLLKGVLQLYVSLYDGFPPTQVQDVEPEVFEKLHILSQLTPTRRNGMREVRKRIAQLAVIP